MKNKLDTSTGLPTGPYIPCLKEGENTYTFTVKELSALIRKAYAEGYQFAKELYYEPTNYEQKQNSLFSSKDSNYELD